MSHKPKHRPVVLCILDGWGYRAEAPDNATSVRFAPTFWDAWKKNPHSLLDASEQAVGLPSGQMGNSEVGHMNLGAGRAIVQELPRINQAIKEDKIASNPALLDFIEKLRLSGGACHLMGLVSPGGVHAHQDHILALAQKLSDASIPVRIHAFLDGRDVPPQSADIFIPAFLKELEEKAPTASMVTLCGRYFAMDRDHRWDRITKAYDLMVDGIGALAQNPIAAIEDSYLRGATDEFLEPVFIKGYEGMQDGDGLLCANFRTDRAREITEALLSPDFDGFARKRKVSFAAALGMTTYSDQHQNWMDTLFPNHAIERGLGEVVAEAGLTQLRLAETEKYAHVTFFFNGGKEEPYVGEDRILIPSPKVATYDLQPEMSAGLITEKLVRAVTEGKHDLIILNYANSDMVGHTGSLAAAQKAVQAVDLCLALLLETVAAVGGVVLITADHGNCETMVDSITQKPHTAHTLARVPVMMIGGPAHVKSLKDGRLADVAPTILSLLGLPQPPEMDGVCLY